MSTVRRNGLRHGRAVPLGRPRRASLFKTADPAQADAGDLVFFRRDTSNGGAGHAAIYLGNGEMVGATNAGVTRDRLDSPYWTKLLVGFGDPPAAWKGRSGGSTAALEQGAGRPGQASGGLDHPPRAVDGGGLEEGRQHRWRVCRTGWPG